MVGSHVSDLLGWAGALGSSLGSLLLLHVEENSDGDEENDYDNDDDDQKGVTSTSDGVSVVCFST